MIDTISPVMTQGARNWIRDQASQLHQAGILASFAFSMECYRPPAAMAARYWDGAPVDLPCSPRKCTSARAPGRT
jgi:hypothetical protein